MKEINPCSKSRKQEKPYEIWAGNGFVYLVLKKYQAPSKEASNPYARWFVAGKSAMTYGRFEMGDMYATEIKKLCSKIWEDTSKVPMPDLSTLEG